MQNKPTVIGILIVIVLGLVGYGIYFYGNKAQNPEEIACTADALICPDGTGVGRTGPQCTFAPCPNKPSFLGTLRETDTGFDLVYGEPAEGEVETMYSIPLIVKEGDIEPQLVGKKVEVFGTFTEGSTLSVSRIEPAGGDPSLGEVGVGETVFINGLRVTLNKLVQDSRCPIDAQCIEAGGVTANVTFESDTEKVTRNMASDEVPTSFDSFKISIEEINPPRYSNSEPKADSYVLTFKVVEGN